MATEHRVATIGEVPPGTMKEVSVDGERLALYNVGGAIFASSNRCPHAGAPLSLGFLEEGKVTCPLHMWSFDVRTGECLTDPDRSSLTTYAVRVEGDTIVVVK